MFFTFSENFSFRVVTLDIGLRCVTWHSKMINIQEDLKETNFISFPNVTTKFANMSMLAYGTHANKIAIYLMMAENLAVLLQV